MSNTKILFMEDEEIIREVLSEYLKMAGYQVTQVEDGQAALDHLLNEGYDLAILDIMVPQISGIEVLKAVHQQKPDLPIIMLTALGDEKTQVEVFNLQADDFIIKPASPIILLKRIETVLRRSRYRVEQAQIETPQSTPVSPQADLTIDELAYKAEYQGKDLELTVSEFLLLQKLFQHPHQVFTRDQLIDAVFGPDYFCSDRVIDTHIKNLRKKIPLDCIKTVIGLGYKYEV